MGLLYVFNEQVHNFDESHHLKDLRIKTEQYYHCYWGIEKGKSVTSTQCEGAGGERV
jgi:hypothetical protein